MSPEVYVFIALIIIPLFLFWRWVFRKKTSLVTRRILIWLLTLISAPIVYVLAILCYIQVLEYYPNRDFSAAAWNGNRDTRYEYTHDLIKSKLLIGKTKQQVTQLLGAQDVAYDDWYYDIGFRPELTGIDPSNIEITFRNGKVVEVLEHDR